MATQFTQIYRRSPFTGLPGDPGYVTPTWIRVTDSQIRVRSNFGTTAAWTAPGKMWVKEGDLGGGKWTPVVYEGLPGTPSTPWVHHWNSSTFDYLEIAFNAPTTGAAVHHYDVRMLDRWGNHLVTKVHYPGVAPWPVPFGAAVGDAWPRANHALQFDVTAYSASGAASATTAAVRVQMGRPLVDRTDYSYPFRDWAPAGTGEVAVYRPNPIGIVVPSNCIIRNITVYNLRTPDGHAVSPYQRTTTAQGNPWPWWEPGWGDGWRHVTWYKGGSVTAGDYLHLHSAYTNVYPGNPFPSSGTWGFNFDNWGNGSVWGIVPTGSGYTAGYDPPYMLYCSNLTVSGVEQYTVATYVVVQSRIENSNTWA